VCPAHKQSAPPALATLICTWAWAKKPSPFQYYHPAAVDYSGMPNLDVDQRVICQLQQFWFLQPLQRTVQGPKSEGPIWDKFKP